MNLWEFLIFISNSCTYVAFEDYINVFLLDYYLKNDIKDKKSSIGWINLIDAFF